MPMPAKKQKEWRRDYNKNQPHSAIGYKAADRHALSRWRHQPAIVAEPGIPSFRPIHVRAFAGRQEHW